MISELGKGSSLMVSSPFGFELLQNLQGLSACLRATPGLSSPRGRGRVRVAAGIGRIQPLDRLTFFPLLPVGEGRDEGWSNATLLPEQFEIGVFDDGFIEAHSAARYACFAWVGAVGNAKRSFPSLANGLRCCWRSASGSRFTSSAKLLRAT